MVVALFFCAVFMTNNSIWFLQAVKKGDTIFIGQYLFTGSETTSVWLEVRKVELEIRVYLSVCIYVKIFCCYFTTYLLAD